MAGKVNALSFDKSCLELFDKLVVPEETDRIESAIALAAHAAEDQKEHDEAVKAEQKKKVIKPEEEICSLVSYSCKRLIRGMSSGRGSARQGFSLALCEILKSVDKLETKLVLDLIDKSLIIDGPGKPQKGGDLRETLLGRVFAYGALLKAGRLNTMKLKSLVIPNLLMISARKDYLSEISFGVVMGILESVSTKDFGILYSMCPKLKDVFHADVSFCQIEMFQLVLWSWKKFGKQKDAPEKGGFAFCGKKYDIQEIFEENFLTDVRPSLLGATCTHPRIHSVWYDLIELIVPSFRPPAPSSAEDESSEEEDDKNKANAKASAKDKGPVNSTYLQLFWSVVVEDGLLQSSLERKYLALELLKALCPLLPAGDLQIVLSEAVLTCLKQNLKKEENYLHTSAKKCVRYLHSLSKRDNMSLEAKAVLSISTKQFSAWVKGANVTPESQDTGSNNEAQFTILKNMFYSSVGKNYVANPKSEGENYDANLLKRQQEMLHQISNICKNSNIEEAVAKEILSFLFKHAFFRFTSNAKKVMDLPQGEAKAITAGVKTLPLALSKYFFDCLVNVLASLFQRPKFAPAYISIRSHLLGLQSELLGLKNASYSRQYSERITETLDVLQNAKERIGAKLEREETNSKLITLAMLVDHLILVQLGEFETAFSSHAKDVIAILDRAFVVASPPKKRKLNEKFASTSLQDDSELQWNDVLLDLMLSLLSLPNQLVRKSVSSVFSSFISEIGQSGLESLVEVLQQSIDDEMDEAEMEEDSEEEEEEEEE
jgi:DNA polymerase phi